MEVKELLDFAGIEAKDLSEFKIKFKDKFITKKDALEDDDIIGPAVSKAIGKITGSMNNILKREFGLVNEDLDGKKYEEALSLAASKSKQQIADLRAANGKGNDENIKDYENKIEKLTNSLNAEKEAKEAIRKDLEAKETDWSGKLKTLKINTKLSAAKEKISSKLIDLTEEQKFFFETKIRENFKIDFDEKDNEIVLGIDGKRIPNPSKAGEYLGLEDAILKIAEEKNYVKKNAGGTVSTSIFAAKTENKEGNKTTERRVHPNAIKAAETLKQAVKQ